MKTGSSLTVLLIISLLTMLKLDAQVPGEKVKVAFLIYPEVALLDYTGPLDVFVKANRMSNNQYEIFTISEHTQTILTQGHVLSTKAEYSFLDAPGTDIFIVPGAKIDIVEALGKNPKYAAFIKEYVQDAQVVMSVCTGSFVLGELGMLNGLKATTHWLYDEKFQKSFPGVELVKNIRYVDEGTVITTSGVTTGIDGAMHLIGKFSGEELARKIEKGLQYKIDLDEPWPKK